MEIIVFTVVLVLLLLLIKEVIEPLHPIIYVTFFFVALSFMLSKVLLPFVEKMFTVLPDVPYGKPLVYSAVLYLIGDQIKQMFEELEYDSLGSILQTTIRILLLMYWLNELGSIFDELKPFIEWLQ